MADLTSRPGLSLLDALAAMYANQAPDEGAWRDKFIADNQDWPDLYKSQQHVNALGRYLLPPF